MVKALLLLPLCILASARGFLNLDPGDWNNCLGWCETYPEPSKPGGRTHWLKNRTTEWVRRNPERAGKAGSFVIICLAVAAAVGWAV